MVHKAAIVVGCLLVCLAAVATAQDAEAPRQASGSFTSKSVELEIRGAYAFEGPVGLGDDPGIRVAVSDGEFITDYIDSYWDRCHWIRERFRPLVAWFHFSPTGEYTGMDYYFGGGNGCGFCFSSDVESTVKLGDGRIAGTLAFSDPDGATFDVTFDVPIAPADYGKPLPEDGGEPGQVYAAFYQALETGDPDTMRPTLDERRRQFLAQAAFIEYLRDSRPDSYTITKAFAKPDWALLLIKGEKQYYGTVEVEVHLIREDGVWVVEDELLKSVSD